MSRVRIEKGKASPRQIAIVICLAISLWWVAAGDDNASVAPGLPNTIDGTEQNTRAQSAVVSARSPRSPARQASQLTPQPAGDRGFVAEVTDRDFDRIVGMNPFFTHRDELQVAAELVETQSVQQPETILKPDPEPESETAATAPLTARDEAAIALSEASVNLFYSSSRGTKAAVINGDVVYPGDVLRDAATVQSMSSAGVEVRWLPLPAAP